MTIGQTMRLATLGMLRRPGDTLTTVIGKQRHWLMPITITLIGVFLTTITLAPQMMATFFRNIPSTQEPSSFIGIATIYGFIGTIGFLTLFCIISLSWIIQGGGLFLISRMGKTNFTIHQIITLLPWLWLPLAFRAILHSAYQLLGGNLSHNGLSFLSGHPSQLDSLGQFVWHVLWQIDLFMVWHLVLVGVVFYRFAQLTVSRTIDAVLIYGVVSIGILAWLANWQAGT